MADVNKEKTGSCSGSLTLTMYGVLYGSNLPKFSNFENPDFQFLKLCNCVLKVTLINCNWEINYLINIY